MKLCNFDKEYRKAKRSYDIDLKIGIAESETQNPKDFWNKLKSLGQMLDVLIRKRNFPAK